MLTEAGIMIALSVLLSRIKIYEAPMGGSVTAGSMIPIILFALRWGGVKPGVITGATFGGVLKLMLGGYVYTPIQAILEYPIAFGLLGLAGIISTNEEFKPVDYLRVVLGVFFCHWRKIFMSFYCWNCILWPICSRGN